MGRNLKHQPERLQEQNKTVIKKRKDDQRTEEKQLMEKTCYLIHFLTQLLRRNSEVRGRGSPDGAVMNPRVNNHMVSIAQRGQNMC